MIEPNVHTLGAAVAWTGCGEVKTVSLMAQR